MTVDYINTLPQELLGMIFSYIDRKELIKSVQNVCQSWKNIVRSTGHLWTKFTYMPEYNESAEKMTKFLQECPMVQSIYFNYANYGPVGRIIAEHCTELRELHLIGHNPVAISYVDLDAILTHNVHIEKLAVYVENKEEAGKITERIGKVENLKFLELRGSSGVSFSSRPLAEGCKLLNDMKINTSCFSTDNLILLLENMKDQLIELHITGEFPDEVMVAIGNLSKIHELRIEGVSRLQNRIKNVSHLNKLKTLTYFFLSVGSSGTPCSDSQIFKSVLDCQWPELKELVLCVYGCDDRPDKLRNLGKVFPHLDTLWLEYESLTHQNLEALWCGELLELEALILVGNWKIDNALFDALRPCKQLQSFIAPVAEGVTDESIASIASFEKLVYLELIECPMTRKGKERLRQLIPNVDLYISQYFK